MTVAIVTLVATIAVETGVALLLQRIGLIDIPGRRLRIDVPLINLATHPIATLVVRNSMAPFAVVEFGVFVAEVFLYRSVTGFRWRDAVVLSGVANGVTVVIALVTHFAIA